MPLIFGGPKQVSASEKAAFADPRPATKAASVQRDEPSDAPAKVAHGRLSVFSKELIPVQERRRQQFPPTSRRGRARCQAPTRYSPIRHHRLPAEPNSGGIWEMSI